MTAVGLRPKRSSEYIMKALAHGKARVIQKIEFSDLAIVKPRSTRMFGSQAPSPSAMPKKAKKQIIPAITRPGYSRRTTPNGSLWVSLAASVRSVSSGTVRSPMRCSRSSARCPWPWVASQRGDSGSEKRRTKITSAPMPMMIQMPRQPIESRKARVSNTPTGHGQAPPINCMNAVRRPRMFFGAYSAV